MLRYANFSHFYKTDGDDVARVYLTNAIFYSLLPLDQRCMQEMLASKLISLKACV